MTTVVTQEQGYTGLALKIPRIVTTSTITQITTAGWYNNYQVASGQPSVNPQDVLAICYSYGTSSQATAFFNVAINGSGVVTLSLADADIVLPTIANHIATYTNTSGTLSEDPATAISGGNIQAGLSGTAGTLASFPATASKGSFVVKAVANTGNTITTLSNDAMGQASTINIPDPANAVGQLVVGATATPFVSGNFPKNSGTAGLMVDSGVPVANLIQTTVSANTQSMTGNLLLNSNPVVVNKTVTATEAALASAGKVNIFVAPTGTAQIAILDIKVFYSTGLSGSSGNRLLSLTDGTLVFNNTGITAALLGTPIFTLWGGTGNPLPSSSEATVSTAGANVYLQYISGTTDYSAGSVIISVTYAQVTT
jgi:hypothetical protein